ncbi:hypothetical protein BU15DRAFT_56394 [Melanogaster broomeanus]|nr:hypothetical protein BU15DRAFT_56394 [Melanogaster broomeanus]
MINELCNDLRCRRSDVKVCWISGHDGVEGNEKADEEAKAAAKNPANTSPKNNLPIFLRRDPLPLSISAIKQAQYDAVKKRWSRLWAASPRYAHLNNIDPKMLSGSFVNLAATLSRRHASMLVWIRTKHSSLNKHMHRITKSDTPNCPHCPESVEDVPHYILSCPHYVQERFLLARKLRRKAIEIPHLLTDTKAVPLFLAFINSTGRFRPTFGNVLTPTQPNS